MDSTSEIAERVAQKLAGHDPSCVCVFSYKAVLCQPCTERKCDKDTFGDPCRVTGEYQQNVPPAMRRLSNAEYRRKR